jgi:hypothetical protein
MIRESGTRGFPMEQPLKGMMIYYVYVGPDVSPADAHVLIDNLGQKSGDLLDDLAESGYKLLYVPVRTGESRVELLKF